MGTSITRRQQRREHRTPPFLITSILVLCVAFTAARGETITWALGANGSWNTATNWDPANVPDQAGEEALIPAGDGPYTITLNTNPGLDRVHLDNVDAILDLGGWSLSLFQSGGLINSGLVRSSASSTILGEITNNVGANLHVDTGTNLYLHGPTLTNNGTIAINPSQGDANAQLRIDASAVALTGTGELVLTTGGAATDAQLNSYASYNVLTQEADHTIRGEGQIGARLINNGTVTADVDGRPLLLVSNAKTNNGLFSATNGAVLEISGVAVTQGEGGTILADGGSVHLTSDTSVANGTLATVNGGAIEKTSGTSQLTDVTNLGQLDLLGGAIFLLYGSTLTNDGTLTINSNAVDNNSVVRVDAPSLSLTGAGELLLQTNGATSDAQLNSYSSSNILTQAPGHTIHGEGELGVALTNEGTVRADVPGRSLVLLNNAKTNNALFSATNGGLLEIRGAAVNQGAGGTILADGGTVKLTSNASVSNGTFATADSGVIERTTGSSNLTDITNTGQFAILGGGLLYLYGSTLTNDGTITINSDHSSSNALIRVDAAALTLSGTGDVRLQTNGADADAQLNSYSSSNILTQATGHTIHGEGQIGAALINEGLVAADVDGRILHLGSNVKTNRGVFRATNLGTLEIAADIVQEGAGVIQADSGSVTLLAGADLTGGTLTTSNGGVIRKTAGATNLVNITNSGQIDILGGSRFYLYGTTLVNDGTITINSDHSSADALIRLDALEYSLSGNGSVVLQTNGAAPDAQLQGYTGSYILTQEAGHTIRGEGQVGVTLINNGAIIADVPGRSLYLGNNTKRNNNLVRAQDNGRLEINPVDFLNSGLVEAADSGIVRVTTLGNHFSSGTLSGGTWSAVDSSQVRLIGANIVTNNASIILDGPGAMISSDDNSTDALAGLASISSSGSLAIRNGRDFQTADIFSNAGQLNIAAATAFTSTGAFTQSLGETRVDGSFTAPSPIDIQAGTLSGNGTVTGDVVNSGKCSPGGSIGTLTIDGNYEQLSDGILRIELGGTGPGESDLLVVAGQAVLAGQLEVTTVDGFTVQPGDTFTIMTCGSRVGEFEPLFVGQCPEEGLCLEVVHNADAVVLVAYEVSTTGIEEGLDDSSPNLPEAIRFYSTGGLLTQNLLRLDLPAGASVEIRIYDVTGRALATLENGFVQAGYYEYSLDEVGRIGNGIYFARARIRSDENIYSKTVRLLRVH